MAAVQKAVPEDATLQLREIQKTLKRLEQRDWWLWGAAVAVMVLLALAVSVLSIPVLLKETDPIVELTRGQATRGLLGVVLLFSVYAVYQQILIKRLRRQLSQQIEIATLVSAQAGELRQVALLDPLTGLYNRRFAEQQLQTEIARADRNSLPLTVLAIDLNNLKEINDTHGHAAGDEAIKEFANRLKKAVRSADLPVRTGGDEFMVLLPECHSNLVPLVLARLSNVEVKVGSVQCQVKFAAGWTGYRAGETPEEFLARADQALYSNKRTNKVEEQVRRAQAQLQQAQKMQEVGRMAGGVAHDFSNLLMLVKGHSELVLERLPADDASRRHLEEIHKAAERASSLTRHLLAFSRRQALQPQVLDLNAVLHDMEPMLRRLLGDEIHLHFQPDPGLGQVRADAGQIEQIVLNLALNAREAMPHGGTLTIETANAHLDQDFVDRHPGAHIGAYSGLSLSDTGTGMDEETKKHIFEPFFTTKRSPKGAGLGLATVYGIIKQSNGYVSVDSKLGRGSTFIIYLPQLAAEEAQAAAETAPAQAVPYPATVLLVEDEEPLRELASEFLRMSGYEVLEASNGIEALRAAEQHPGTIDLLMTDVVMPGMGGRQLAERLSAQRPEMKVLYMSGYTDEVLMGEARANPKAYFLQKPFSRETLASTLGELMGAHPEARSGQVSA